MKRNIFILLIIASILIVFSTLTFASQTINVKDYIKDKFPSIFGFYLSSLENLDSYEKEFIDLLQKLPEEEQEYYAKEVYKNGFSLELLEKLKKGDTFEKPILNWDKVKEKYEVTKEKDEKYLTKPKEKTLKGLPEIIKKIEPSTVIIFSYDNKGNVLRQGSGFFISQNGDIITNYHVIQGASSVYVKTSDDKVYPIAYIVASDEKSDIIRFSIDIPSKYVQPLSLSTTLPEVGERIIVYGSPLGLEKTVSDGIVSAIREIPDFGKIIQITAPTSSGSSGSPVLNMNGEVIGIATFQFIEGQNLNFAISSEKIFDTVFYEERKVTKTEISEKNLLLLSSEEIYRIAIEYVDQKRYEEALKIFNLSILKDKDFVNAYYYAGWTCIQLERYDNAISYLKKTLELNEQSSEAYFYLGLAYFYLDKLDESVKSFNELLSRKGPFKQKETLLCLGVIYDRLEKYEKAIEYYERYIDIDSDNADVFYRLGSAYIEVGQKKHWFNKEKYFTEAVKYLNKSIYLEPNKIDAYLSLSAAYMGLENYPLAYSTLREIILLEPDNAIAYYGMGICAVRCKNDQLAIEAYNKLRFLDVEKANDLFTKIQHLYKYGY